MKKISNILIAFSIFIMINTMILLELATSIFFLIDNAFAQIENSTNYDDDNISNPTNDNPTNNTQQQHVIETQCKSPCPPNAEMCIEMCA